MTARSGHDGPRAGWPASSREPPRSPTYANDAQGRRKSRTAGGATTVFVTDAEDREVLEYDGTGGAVTRWYAYGLGPDEVLGK